MLLVAPLAGSGSPLIPDWQQGKVCGSASVPVTVEAGSSYRLPAVVCV